MDFIRRPGDPAHTEHLSSKPQKWGGRTLISNVQALLNTGLATRSTTIIGTGDLGRPRAINVQMRFAVNGANNQPVLPFYEAQPLSVTTIDLTVRRGNDPSASPTVDKYTMNLRDVLPFDIVTARELGIEVAVTVAESIFPVTVWVEAIATPCDFPSAVNQIFPWNVTQVMKFQAASAVATTILAENIDRVQFFLCNTSTNADLLVGFGVAPTWLPNPVGTIVLPRNSFAQYESPAPFGFKNKVFGIWNDPAPNGGVIVTEGTCF